MDGVSYKPLIEDMEWSYSRIRCFDSCPWSWFLKYIRGWRENDMFYSDYGSLMHRILAQYYSKELSKEELPATFLTFFMESVSKSGRPKTGTVVKYIDSAMDYLRNFEPLPIEVLGVEKRVTFEIDGVPFIGFLDLIGRDENGLIIVDHKSRDLKKRSGRTPPTARDADLDGMLRQLYLYSAGVEKELGELPETLCFNCFRTGEIIKEPFDKKVYEEVKRWAVFQTRMIAEEDEFPAKPDFFQCRYLCGLNDRCEYCCD